MQFLIVLVLYRGGFNIFLKVVLLDWFNPNEEGMGYNDVNTIAKGCRFIFSI